MLPVFTPFMFGLHTMREDKDVPVNGEKTHNSGTPIRLRLHYGWTTINILVIPIVPLVVFGFEWDLILSCCAMIPVITLVLSDMTSRCCCFRISMHRPVREFKDLEELLKGDSYWRQLGELVKGQTTKSHHEMDRMNKENEQSQLVQENETIQLPQNHMTKSNLSTSSNQNIEMDRMDKTNDQSPLVQENEPISSQNLITRSELSTSANPNIEIGRMNGENEQPSLDQEDDST